MRGVLTPRTRAESNIAECIDASLPPPPLFFFFFIPLPPTSGLFVFGRSELLYRNFQTFPTAWTSQKRAGHSDQPKKILRKVSVQNLNFMEGKRQELAKPKCGVPWCKRLAATLSERKFADSVPTIGDFHTVGP